MPPSAAYVVAVDEGVPPLQGDDRKISARPPSASFLCNNLVPGEPGLFSGYPAARDHGEATPFIQHLNKWIASLNSQPKRHLYPKLCTLSKSAPPLAVESMVQQSPVGLAGAVAGKRTTERLTREAWWEHDRVEHGNQSITPDVVEAEKPTASFSFKGCGQRNDESLVNCLFVD